MWQMPVVAIFPPLHDAILTRLSQMGRVAILGVDWTHLYLLQTPAAKLLLACSSQLALAVLITILPSADISTASDDGYSAFAFSRLRTSRDSDVATADDEAAAALQRYVPWLLVWSGAALYHDVTEVRPRA